MQALRDAYEAAVTDPEMLEKAATMELPVEPLVGAPVGEAVAEALNQTPEMIEYLKSTLKDD